MHRSIAKPHHYIPHSYLDQIIRLVRQRGYELAGIEADPAYLALHQQSLDSSIDFSDFKHFIKLISDLTQDPYLGLYLGREVPITANRFVGYAISSSETLRDAFEVARRFLPTLYNVLDFELAATEELASIRVYPLADLSPIADFMYDMAVSYLDLGGLLG